MSSLYFVKNREWVCTSCIRQDFVMTNDCCCVMVCLCRLFRFCANSISGSKRRIDRRSSRSNNLPPAATTFVLATAGVQNRDDSGAAYSDGRGNNE